MPQKWKNGISAKHKNMFVQPRAPIPSRHGQAQRPIPYPNMSLFDKTLPVSSFACVHRFQNVLEASRNPQVKRPRRPLLKQHIAPHEVPEKIPPPHLPDQASVGLRETYGRRTPPLFRPGKADGHTTTTAVVRRVLELPATAGCKETKHNFGVETISGEKTGTPKVRP